MANNQMSVFELVGQQESLFIPVLTDEKISWSKEKQFAIQALQANDFLAKIAMSNPISFQNAIINVASIGVSLNPALKHAYLVPRKGNICLDISYMGLLHLAMSTGSIVWGQCKIVYANDTYENVGLDKTPIHKYNAFGDRGAIAGAYCTVKTIGGDYLTDEMSIADINIIKGLSESAASSYSPWNKHFNEMARKTVVKRASKYWPSIDRLSDAINHLNTDGGEGLELNQAPPVDVTPIAEHEEADLTKAIEATGKTIEQFLSWASKMFKRNVESISNLSQVEFKRSMGMVSK